MLVLQYGPHSHGLHLQVGSNHPLGLLWSLFSYFLTRSGCLHLEAIQTKDVMLRAVMNAKASLVDIYM